MLERILGRKMLVLLRHTAVSNQQEQDMLTIAGRRSRFCDGISRRNFLNIGGLALGGISLSQLLRAEQQATRGQRTRTKRSS